MTEVYDPQRVKVKIKRVRPNAIGPIKASAGAACFDLHADLAVAGPINIVHGTPAIIGTGIAVEIPPGFVMLIFSRSGHGFTRANCVGVIDNDYRGEILVKLVADKYGQLTVYQGDRIAQAMVIPYPEVRFDWTDELSSTTRGTGGLGSTGQGAING
jgi:dUTP pyrophosphatase